MPRNVNKYQYETSPRKLEPEYIPSKNPYKTKKTVALTMSRKRKIQIKGKELKKRKMEAIKYLIVGFIIFFAICYRNSQIDENFAKVQKLKERVSEVEKENAQLQVAIENGLNFNNVEQEAKKQLGMQKLNSKQTIYIKFPKNDYIESASEKVIIKEKETGLKGIINVIMNIFK